MDNTSLQSVMSQHSLNLETSWSEWGFWYTVWAYISHIKEKGQYLYRYVKGAYVIGRDFPTEGFAFPSPDNAYNVCIRLSESNLKDGTAQNSMCSAPTGLTALWWQWVPMSRKIMKYEVKCVVDQLRIYLVEGCESDILVISWGATIAIALYVY